MCSLHRLPSLGPGRVAAASARENLLNLFGRLPEHRTASAILDEPKALAAEVESSKKEDAVGASWAAPAAGEDPRKRGIGILLLEVRAIERRRVRGRRWRRERGR